eukprot:CAMPEP_0175161562 /NCGR_PEP_ID=MMETSP0087-20121206/24674_1 /TAXON_ID=136419 /ORGANISM="Unknown Unknown, Strain D1" /LENGTH=512 /DNA_ID=CAMNT_0016449991 /DNA_START=121 /DNA_END=1659 /DNA_ORIENTATION=+
MPGDIDSSASSSSGSSTGGEGEHVMADNEQKTPPLPTNSNRSNSEQSTQKRQGLTKSLLHLRGTNKRLVMATVGLPGRGKTFLAKKLSRYLNWLSYSTKVFNVGSYRRKLAGDLSDSSSSDESDDETQQCRQEALADMLHFFQDGGGNVAIYDGQNTREVDREVVRQYLAGKMSREATGLDISLVWIEVVITDQTLVEENILELYASSPAYQGSTVTAEAVTAEMRARIAYHEEQYQPLGPSNEEESYISIINSGSKVVTNNIHGYLMGKIVFFLMSCRGMRHPIYISRHGESQYNTVGKLGGDSSLSARGQQYARELAKFMASHIQPKLAEQQEKLSVWCSTMCRTQETSAHVAVDEITPWRALAEIDAGVCEHLTLEEVESRYPQIAKDRRSDKLRYRYPQGESYEDVICRLEPVLFELHRHQTGPVLVVGHRAVLRCLYAYFLDIPSDQIPHLSVPLHTVIKITPRAYGCDEERIPLGVASVDDAVADEKGFVEGSTNLPEVENKRTIA